MSDVYIVIGCPYPNHRRVNDLLVTDPHCPWCRGLGIVRVRRDHVPAIRLVGSSWESAPTVVEQIGDMADDP